MGIDNKDIDPFSDCSFDETSMDSCPLAAITETPRGNDLSKDGNEVEVTSLEEAKSVIAALRARQRAQAHQMLAWRRTLKLQVRREIRKKKKKEHEITVIKANLVERKRMEYRWSCILVQMYSLVLSNSYNWLVLTTKINGI